MLTTSWTPGPAERTTGTVLVSVTAFTGTSARDLPGIYRAGLRLRRAWPELHGAVGMWLWAEPRKLRSGSVSVWESEADLHAFVAWSPHVAIMKRFRHRGAVRALTWEAARFDRREIWDRAERELTSTLVDLPD